MVGFAPERVCPECIGDFGNVNIVVRVQCNAVRGDKSTWLFAESLCADVGENFAFLRVDDCHSGAEIGCVTRESGYGIRRQFTDDPQRTAAATHEQTARSREA